MQRLFFKMLAMMIDPHAVVRMHRPSPCAVTRFTPRGSEMAQVDVNIDKARLPSDFSFACTPWVRVCSHFMHVSYTSVCERPRHPPWTKCRTAPFQRPFLLPFHVVVASISNALIFDQR